jgi:hypothetical protein
MPGKDASRWMQAGEPFRGEKDGYGSDENRTPTRGG